MCFCLIRLVPSQDAQPCSAARYIDEEAVVDDDDEDLDEEDDDLMQEGAFRFGSTCSTRGS